VCVVDVQCCHISAGNDAMCRQCHVLMMFMLYYVSIRSGVANGGISPGVNQHGVAKVGGEFNT